MSLVVNWSALLGQSACQFEYSAESANASDGRVLLSRAETNVCRNSVQHERHETVTVYNGAPRGGEAEGASRHPWAPFPDEIGERLRQVYLLLRPASGRGL